MDRSSPEYARMKEAWHEIYGGSPKHDSPSEEFQAGWEARDRVGPIHVPMVFGGVSSTSRRKWIS